MTQEIISKFREKPKTKIAWKAMYLGIATLFIPTFLGIFAAVIRPLIDKVGNESVGRVIGFGAGLFVFGFSIYALITSIRAWKIGERSWAMWLGLIPSILICLFWVFMIIGELVFPH